MAHYKVKAVSVVPTITLTLTPNLTHELVDFAIKIERCNSADHLRALIAGESMPRVKWLYNYRLVIMMCRYYGVDPHKLVPVTTATHTLSKISNNVPISLRDTINLMYNNPNIVMRAILSKNNQMRKTLMSLFRITFNPLAVKIDHGSINGVALLSSMTRNNPALIMAQYVTYRA